MKDEPRSPPIVGLPGGEPVVAYLLMWEQHERSGEWWAWVTWVRERNGQPYRHVTTVQAQRLVQLDLPGTYRAVPRRVLGHDGQFRPWSPGTVRPPRGQRPQEKQALSSPAPGGRRRSPAAPS
jgi:hypothetical protein